MTRGLVDVYFNVNITRRLFLGKEIEPVSVARDLGVYIDQTLCYNEHISKLVSSCVYKLVQFNRIKHLLDNKALLLMINAFRFSKLFLNCSTVWGNTSKTNIKKHQLAQNFAVKIVLCLRNSIIFPRV